MTTIMPTHRCFDDAVEIIESAVRVEGDWAVEHMRLVHAICLAPEGPTAGEPFAHAWVELDTRLVIFAGMVAGTREYFVTPRRDHYRELRVQCTTVYTPEEAWMKNRETNHVGPWEPTYVALCSSTHTVFQEAANGSISEASVDCGVREVAGQRNQSGEGELARAGRRR